MQRKKLSVIAAVPLLVAAVGGCDGTAGPVSEGIETTVSPWPRTNGLIINGLI